MFQMSLFRHQEAVINSIRRYPDIPYVFLIGGYGCGKSATDVALCLYLYESYHDSPEPVTVGIFGVTIKLLKQTVVADLERAFERGGIAYKDNSQAGTIKAGNVTFVYLAMQNPDDIYAFNFHCAICDEIDEVPAEKVMPIVTAIQERCRKTMPAGHHMPSRPPFICFTTTAQGLGGTYQLLKHLEKRDLPYIKIRGRTADNTSIDPQQLELLMGLYDGDERRAFLEGEFVNLSTGRVYPVFDMSKHRINPIPLMPGEHVFVGQDFNAGYNAAVICIVRGNIIYAVREERWDYVGDAAVKLREMFPNSQITFIPDASGKEIMSGFAEEFSRNNIDIHWNNVNPSITERITAVNNAFRYGQLFIFDGLESLLLGLETRDFDDMGKPRKGKGPKALDHHCDAFEYAVWHIIHTITGYDRLLDKIAAVHHNRYTYGGWDD